MASLASLPAAMLAGQRLEPRRTFRSAASTSYASIPERSLQLGVTAAAAPGRHHQLLAAAAAPQAADAPAAAAQPSPWAALASRFGQGAAVLALASALAFGSVSPAEAARSGGRMGGSSFSGRASYSSSSLGGGGSGFGSRGSGMGMGGGSGLAFGGHSSRSLHSFSGRGRSSSVGSMGSSLSMPSLMFFSPFGYGGYGMGGGGGITSLLFFGVMAAILLQVVQGVLRSRNGGSIADSSSGGDGGGGGGDRVTVVKVQVGLLGSARQLQRDLERIAGRADTSSPAGLHYVLQETVLALMRNPDYCLYAAAASSTLSSPQRAETRFNELSLEERGKFEAETLVNVGGRSKRGALARPPGEGPAELIVVTLLVAAEGSARLPNITSRDQLKSVLARLGALRADDVLAVEVLWTPEEEGDYFSRDDLAYDYPTLNTL